MGLHHNISNETYHTHDSISKSGLDLLDRSPAHYKASLSFKRKESDAMKMGTLIHTAVLEPDSLMAIYFEAEKFDGRTTSGKAKQAEQMELAGIRILISPDEMNMALRIRDEISKHKVAKLLFDGGVAEVSAFSKLNDVNVRSRPDYLNGSVIIDLKSTDDASKSFEYSVKKYRYFVQHPFYFDVLNSIGIDISKFLFVAVEKIEPYGVGIFELDRDYVDYGRRVYQKNLDTYKACLESGVWPGYVDTIQSIGLPRYLAED